MTRISWLIWYLGWKLWKRSSRRAWFSRIYFSKWNNKTSTIGWKNKRNKQWTKRNIRRKCRKNRRRKFQKIFRKISFSKYHIPDFFPGNSKFTNFEKGLCYFASIKALSQNFELPTNCVGGVIDKISRQFRQYLHPLQPVDDPKFLHGADFWRQKTLSEKSLNLTIFLNNEFQMFLVINACTVLFMQCGFALLEAGAVRAKNVTNILIKNLLDACEYKFKSL